MITWRPVTSNNVAQVGWPAPGQIVVTGQVPDHDSNPPIPQTWEPHLLLVRFKNGKCYGYLGVSRQRAIYMATRCESVGSYVNRVIKPNFECVRIPELDVNGPPF